MTLKQPKCSLIAVLMGMHKQLFKFRISFAKYITVSAKNTHLQNILLLVLRVFRVACLGQEPLGQLLEVARVVHLDFGLLAEEVLQVLQELHAELTLLVQTLELLHQLSSNLCQTERKKRKQVIIIVLHNVVCINVF